MIFYAHVNEDNRAEKSLMDQGNYDSLITVCGSGERVISLLAHPALKKVEIVDINPEALYLLELKLAALRHCSVEDYLGFIGNNKSPMQRESTYASVRHLLTSPAQNFWDHNPEAIRSGILNMGHFEKFLSGIRPFLKFFLGKDFYQLLLYPDHVVKRWTRWKWELTKKIFSLRIAYQWAGMKDESFIGRNADQKIIPRALQTLVDTGSFHTCFMAHLIFHGHLHYLPDNSCPPSLQPDTLQNIKSRLLANKLRLKFHSGDYLQKLPILDGDPAKKRIYSLSDLLSFTDLDYLKNIIRQVSLGEEGHYLLVVRSFLKNRMTKTFLQSLKLLGIRTNDCSHLDHTAMYQVVTAEPSNL